MPAIIKINEVPYKLAEIVCDIEDAATLEEAGDLMLAARAALRGDDWTDYGLDAMRAVNAAYGSRAASEPVRPIVPLVRFA